MLNLSALVCAEIEVDCLPEDIFGCVVCVYRCKMRNGVE
jgi:hypothetical protein